MRKLDKPRDTDCKSDAAFREAMEKAKAEKAAKEAAMTKTISMTTCGTCGSSYVTGGIHICTTSCWPTTPYPTDIYKPTTGVVYPSVIPSPKDINWKQYTAANPPVAGNYIVTAICPTTRARETFFSIYEPSTYTWVDVKDIDDKMIVTHYAKIELP